MMPGPSLKSLHPNVYKAITKKKSHNTTQTKQTPILIYIGYIICNNVEIFKNQFFQRTKLCGGK
jgi:hypothetical protein